MSAAGGPLGPAKAEGGPGRQDELGLPRLPGFREMALRRMAGERRRLVGELTAQRQAAGLSQTQVAARMGTSQSAVARLEAGGADVRASTLERYAAAIGVRSAGGCATPRPRRSGRRPGRTPALAAVLVPVRAGRLGVASEPTRAVARTRPARAGAQHQPCGQRQEDSHGRSRG